MKKFLWVILIYLNQIPFNSTQPGMIIPDKTYPITLNSTNAGDRAQYNFTWAFSSNYLEECQLRIRFPENYFYDGLGLNYDFIIYNGLNNFITSSYKNKNLIIKLKNIEKFKFTTITIEGVKNPFKVGGTANFSMFYECNDLIVNQNWNFGTIAITKPKIKLKESDINFESGSSQYAGDLTNYIIKIVPQNDISKNSVFRIIFPDYYDFSRLQTQIIDFPSHNPCEVLKSPNTSYIPKGSWKCKFNKFLKNIVIWEGLLENISKNSEIYLRFKGLNNPNKALITENFKINILLKNSNYTYEYDDSVAGLSILPGRINRLSLKPEADNNLDVSTNYNFILSFEPISIFKRIHLVTNFQSISNCFIINNLLPNSINENIKCDIDVNNLDIYNFQEYKKTGLLSRDLIKIKFNAKTISLQGNSLPAELYLYDTFNLEYKTGQNITASTTTIKISNALPVQLATTISTPSNLNPNQANNLDLTLIPISNYTVPEFQVILKFSFDKLFEFGIDAQNPIKCSYLSEYEYEDLISGVLKRTYSSIVNCDKDPLNDSTLRIILNDGTNKMPLLYKNTSVNYLNLINTIKIENIKNPEIGGMYNVNMLVFVNEEPNPREKYAFLLNIASPSFTLNHEYLIQERNYPTLLKLNFNSSILLESANQNINNYYESFSEISIDFIQKVLTSSSISWSHDWDLGIINSSLVSCYESDDLKVITGGLKCIITWGPDPEVNDKIINIRITNYKRITIGKRITIYLILKFSNNQNFDFNFKINKINKGEKYSISQSSKSISLSAISTTTPINSFSSTVSNLNVQDNIIIRINFNITSNKSINDKVIFTIFLPENWEYLNTKLIKTEVLFDNIQIFTPKYFFDNNLNIIIIYWENSISSGNHIIELRNIKTPNFENTNNILKFDYIENVAGVQKLINSSTINYGPISCFLIPNIKLYTNIKKSLAPGSTYFFEFITNKEYYKPKFEIILPSSSYTFINNTVYLSELYINNIKKNIASVVYFFGSNRFEIVFNEDIKIGTKIVIQLKYLTNPNSIITSESFTLNIYNKFNNIFNKISCQIFTMPDDFMSINIGANFNSAKGIISNIELNIPHAKYYHWMRIKFKFETDLPKNSIIKISLPNEYKVINAVNNYECYSFGIYVIKTCNTIFSSPPLITYIILEEYNKNEDLIFDFIGTSTFELISSNFEINGEYYLKNWKIEAIYDGIILSQTNIFNNIKVFNSLDNKILINTNNLDFFPQNESIEAEYILTIDIRFLNLINSNWIIFIKFPREYDVNLSNNSILIESNLEGALHNTIRNREIEIWGFYTQNITSITKFYIRRIMNPIKNGSILTNNFEFFILNKSDRKVIAYTSNIKGILVTSSPKIMEMITISSSNKYVRYNSNYTFELNSNKNFIDSRNNGSILIDIPYDYNLNPFLSICTTQEAFSLYSICTQNKNRITVSSANKDYFTEVQGNLIFNLSNLRNPEKVGLSGNFIFMNYDGISKNVISSTYPNLSISSFIFDIDALEIIVNNNETIQIEVGSFIDPIKIQPKEKMKQLLNIIPLYFDANILFNKNPVVLKRNSLYSEFRIAVPQNMLLKDFYITWSKSGDLLERFYTELEKTRIRVVKGTLNRKIFIKNTLYANKDGLSIPILINTNNGPYENVTVKIEKLGSINFVLSSNTIEFFSGEQKKYLIFSGLPNLNNINDLEIKLSLQGIDQNSYIWDREVYRWKLNSKDNIYASILNIQLENINRSSAQLKIKANKLCYIYCVTGYKYMPSISFRETRDKVINDKIKYSNPIFSQGWVEGNEFTGYIKINGLYASYEYTTYCYSMNLNRVGSDSYSKINFKANNPQKTGQFTLKILQNLVNNNLRNEYIKRLAALMQLRSNRITEEKKCKGNNANQLVEKGSTFITYFVLPDPKEENVDLAPIVFIRNLNKNRREIKKFIPKIADGDLIQIEEVSKTEIFHQFRPLFLEKTNVSLSFNTSFTQCGNITIGIEEIPLSKWSYSSNETYFSFENDQIRNLIDLRQQFYPYGLGSTIIEQNTFKEFQAGIFGNTTVVQRLLKQIKYSTLTIKERYPTSFQLTRSLDLNNQKLKNIIIKRQDDIRIPINFNITDLNPNTIYNIYITINNDLPWFPDYLNNYYVSLLNLKTVSYVRILDIISLRDFQYILAINILLFLLIIK